jgi:hypothetical protein
MSKTENDVNRVEEIRKANRNLECASLRAERAARKAFVAASELKWASVHSPTSAVLGSILQRTVLTHQKAIAAFQKREAACAALAAAWRQSVEAEATAAKVSEGKN